MLSNEASAQMIYPLRGKRVWVAGHAGMVGSALVRALRHETCAVLTVTRAELDLRRQARVEAWVQENRPDVVLLAAATVGGILANDSRPAEFIYDNMMIEANVIDAAHHANVEKLLFLGSSCIYPRQAAQPIGENALLTGSLEPTNEWYAVAKIAGIKLAQAYRRQYACDYISAMPTNLYGPGDNFDLASSHVMPALIRKAHEAKVNGLDAVTVWGTGSPRREFLHVDDLAAACIFLVKSYSAAEHVNVGAGRDIPILDLTRLVCSIVGFEGKIVHDLTKPDGTPAKLMSSAKLQSLGWSPTISLRDGITTAYRWFLDHQAAPPVRDAALQPRSRTPADGFSRRR